MPQMTGFELIERLRAHPRAKDVPIVVWTIKSLSARDRARLRRDAAAIVAKNPGGTATLVRELDRVLSGRSVAEQAVVAIPAEAAP